MEPTQNCDRSVFELVESHLDIRRAISGALKGTAPVDDALWEARGGTWSPSIPGFVPLLVEASWILYRHEPAIHCWHNVVFLKRSVERGGPTHPWRGASAAHNGE